MVGIRNSPYLWLNLQKEGIEMAARWKHPNYKNYHEQMKIRCALVAYSYNYGAAAAASKFECSIPCVYQWRDKLYETKYWNYIQMIERHEDYDTYIIFNQ